MLTPLNYSSVCINLSIILDNLNNVRFDGDNFEFEVGQDGENHN